jgi:hypothetical protein
VGRAWQSRTVHIMVDRKKVHKQDTPKDLSDLLPPARSHLLKPPELLKIKAQATNIDFNT